MGEHDWLPKRFEESRLVPQQALDHERIDAKVVETRADGVRKLTRG